MKRLAAGVAMVFWACSSAYGEDEPSGLLDQFRERMKVELNRLPDYVCNRSVERFSRPGAERKWQPLDTLDLVVAYVGDEELYSRPGERDFRNRTLSDLAGKGTISTGQFGLLARHVFLGDDARIGYRGPAEVRDRKAHEYDFDVPAGRSRYSLRSSNAVATVAFQGSFHVDEETLDLLQFEVQAYDIPERLGLAQADTRLSYSRVPLGDAEPLLPVSAVLIVVGTDGFENLNRARLTGCKRFGAESSLKFDADVAAPVAEVAEKSEPVILPPGALLELALGSALNPGQAQLGDRVSAHLMQPVGDGDQPILPRGTKFSGTLVRIEKTTVSFPVYEIGLQLDTVETDEGPVPFSATMVEVESAPGVLKQSRRLDPKFATRGKAQLQMLVREVQQGQGILLWDARRGAVPSGLKMKWRVQESSGLAKKRR